MKWSFLTKIQVEDLASFLRNLKSYGIDQRAKEIGVLKYKLKLQYKRFTPDLEFAYLEEYRFSIDTNEQFQIALPLHQDKHELIDKF